MATIHRYVSSALMVILLFPIKAISASPYDSDLEFQRWKKERGYVSPFSESSLESQQACKTRGIIGQYYQECIIETMPSTRNTIAVIEAKRHCQSKAPCSTIKEKKSSYFGISNSYECFSKFGSNHPIKEAAIAIRSACNDLYVQ